MKSHAKVLLALGIMLNVCCLSACLLKKEKIDLDKVKLSMIMLKNKPKIDTAIFNKYIRQLDKKGKPHMLDLLDTLKIESKVDSQIIVQRRIFRLLGGEYILTEFNFDGEMIKETKLLQYYPEIQVKERIDKYFISFDEYYLSGLIKSRLIRSKFNFYVGKKYYYDEEGDLVNMVDTDEGYHFTYEDVLKFYVRKWKRLVDDDYGIPVKIDRGTIVNDNNKKYWSLTHKNEKTGLSDVYFLDSQSGRVFKKLLVDERVIK